MVELSQGRDDFMRLNHASFYVLFLKIIWPLLALSVPAVWSKEVNQTEQLEDIRYERCLGQIFSHHSMWQYKHRILERSPASHLYIQQLDQYCRCNSKQVALEETLMKKDAMAYAFHDRQQFYSNLDQCALQTLDNHLLVVAFSAFFENYLQHILLDRLTNRWPASITNVALEESYQERINCLQQDLELRCTRVTSLQMSYQCIINHTSQNQLIAQVGEHCETYRTDHTNNAIQAMKTISPKL
jgi:hypothetical protein